MARHVLLQAAVVLAPMRLRLPGVVVRACFAALVLLERENEGSLTTARVGYGFAGQRTSLSSARG